MKRKLTLFLSAVMATSCLPMTAYAANFKDINDVPWASGVINSVADKGLLSGYEDGTFRGKNNVTYCEAMQMVYTTMVKSGAAASMDAVTVYGYMQSLDVLNVPKWAQMAVAYGLSEGIIDMQMVATKFAGGNKTATREDVAIIFGNAVGKVFGKEKDTSGAQSFVDYWNISVNALEQVHLLKKMEIISGDENRRFNPKQNITRAEMAVMLNKTYDKMEFGIGVNGEIVLIEKNLDRDGAVYYYLEVKTSAGYKENFSIAEKDVPVYAGNTDEKISWSKLSKGDDVSLVFSGTKLISVRQLDAVTKQEQYDLTGYVNYVKNDKIYLENENTGETTEYKLYGETVCYVDGVKVLRNKLDDVLKENTKQYAYAGINTEIKREKIGSEYQDVIYADEIHIFFVDEYSVVGKLSSFNNTNIVILVGEGEDRKDYRIVSGCKYIIDEEEVSYSEMKNLAASGTVYAKVKLNNQDKAIIITMSEAAFGGTKEQDTSKTYIVSGLTDKKLAMKDGDEKISYAFGSTNPIDNIRFYTWDAYAQDWEPVSASQARTYADAETYTGKDGLPKDVDEIYARVAFNDGGKLDKVYLSAVRSAWRVSDETKSERKGDVVSIENDILKFSTSSTEYKLLKKYSGTELLIEGVPTSSKTVLTRLANDEDVELYAEIVANGDNEVTNILARPKAAVGKLVKWDRDNKQIEIDTADGHTFKFTTQKNPRLTGEKENVFELEDVASPTYHGSWIELGFTDAGIVNEFTLTDGPKNTSATDVVKGIATAAYDGLEVDGETYPWLGRTADITTANFSCPQESLSVVKDLIEDPDVEVYVEATLNDDGKVDSIKAYVREAEGELTAFGDSVRILTDSGNKFSFNRETKLDVCDIAGYDQDDLEDFDRGIGEDVVLTFTNRGEVNKIESK